MDQRGWMMPIYGEGYTNPFFRSQASGAMQPWGFAPPPFPAMPPMPPMMPPNPQQMMRQMSETMGGMEQQMQRSMDTLFPYFPPGEYRPSSSPSQLAPVEDDTKYKIQINAPEYQPNEITVKTVERDGKNFIVAEGKHETRDAGGYHSVHHFRRQYMIPESVRPEAFTSHLTAQGTLTIEAPKHPPQPAQPAPTTDTRNIPVEQKK